MKTISLALMCLLLAAVWLQDVDSKSMHVVSSSCCLSPLKKKLSLKFIKCYREIGGSTCPHPKAVEFRLKKGRKSCALTNVTWVQDLQNKLNLC
ncbi:C-C motif chemokine 1 [Apodemus sylvaticus]|uniref:C-C motif chemokine 1 n=1 Tax=Apodemus sylvaticus TaxID=10129 RepID=UPI002241D491|nr:C-C motif chemokine 1 [Apodemus sylvaticus]